MVIYLKTVLFSILLLFAMILPNVASAQSRDALIKERCTSIKAYLSQAQKVDLVDRTNRGRVYESILRQVDAFTKRVKNNKMSSEQTDKFYIELQNSIGGFRSTFQRYDESLTELSHSDCLNNTSQFVSRLDRARGLRQEVGREVDKISEATTRYRLAVVELNKQLGPAQ